MRKVVYGGACSLDGFITGPGGSIDWIRWSEDLTDFMRDYWAATDTLVMGRKTWEFAAAAGSGGDSTSFGDVKSYVFSRTLQRIDSPGVQLVSTDAIEFVRNLKHQKGKNITVFGGGEFARSLFEADLIDEVGFNVQPVLLGSGVPGFLDATRRIDLELLECRQLKGGCVLLTYKVKHVRQRRTNVQELKPLVSSSVRA
jgi:dihydrofolate reductase